MKKNNLKFSHTNYNIIDEKDKIIGKFNSPKQLTYSKLINSCDIGTSTVMIDRSIIHMCRIPKTQNQRRFCCMVAFCKKYIIISIDKFLTYWRSTGGSLSSSITQRFYDAFKVYHYYENFNIIKSIFFTINLSLHSLIKKLKFIFKMSVFYQFFVYLILLVFVNSFLIKKNLLIDSPQIDKHKKKFFFLKMFQNLWV